MTADFYDIFYYCSLVLSVVVSCFLFRKADEGFRWLTVLLIITLINESVAKYVAYGLHQSNGIVYHIFTPIEYTLYVIIVSKFLRHKKLNILLWLSALGLILFEIVDTHIFQSIQLNNAMIAESTLLVILSLILFLKIRQTPSKENIINRGVFWFASAMLCYYAFNILIWGFHNMKVYLLDNPPQIIYDFNMILSGILYLTFTIAIILHAKSKTQSN